MAYDFPNAPTDGQTFNQYIWDTTKWEKIGDYTPAVGGGPPAGKMDFSSNKNSALVDLLEDI